MTVLLGFERAYPPPALPVLSDSLYPLSIHVKMWLWKAFHTFIHFFSHQFTENEPFSSYTRHNIDVFLLIHPLNITQVRAAVLLESKGDCRRAKSTNSKLSFRPVGFSPLPLCVWSWSVPFLQLGHNVGGYSSGHLVNTRGEGGRNLSERQ